VTASAAVLDGGAGAAGVLPGSPQGAGLASRPERIATGLSFGPLQGAVPCARLHAKHVLREWGVTGDPADTIELVVSDSLNLRSYSFGPLWVVLVSAGLRGGRGLRWCWCGG
jgi:hypothetical protein